MEPARRGGMTEREYRARIRAYLAAMARRGRDDLLRVGESRAVERAAMEPARRGRG